MTETGAGGAGFYYHLRITSDEDGGAIIAWDDDRSGELDIFAQRITAAGEMPVATMLHSWDASIEGGMVTISWTLNQIGVNARFAVFRKSVPDGDPVPGIEAEPLPVQLISSDGLAFSCADRTCEPDMRYCYIVEVVDEEGGRILFETDVLSIPAASLSLYQNYPNPFNPVTSIEYYLPDEASVEVSIYDIAGQRIAVLVSGYREKGRHTVTWNGTNEDGRPVESGTYFCRLTAGKKEIARKILLLR